MKVHISAIIIYSNPSESARHQIGQGNVEESSNPKTYQLLGGKYYEAHLKFPMHTERTPISAATLHTTGTTSETCTRSTP